MGSKRLGSFRQILFAVSAFCIVVLVGYGSDLILFRHAEWMIAHDLVLAFAAAIISLSLRTGTQPVSLGKSAGDSGTKCLCAQ